MTSIPFGYGPKNGVSEHLINIKRTWNNETNNNDFI